MPRAFVSAVLSTSFAWISVVFAFLSVPLRASIDGFLARDRQALGMISMKKQVPLAEIIEDVLFVGASHRVTRFEFARPCRSNCQCLDFMSVEERAIVAALDEPGPQPLQGPGEVLADSDGTRNHRRRA